MKDLESGKFSLPSTGAVLGFMIDCLGVPKNGDHFNYKQLERLRKGGLASNEYWRVARKAMAGIISSFLEGQVADQKLEVIQRQRASAPVKRRQWKQHGSLLVPTYDMAPPVEALHWRFNPAGDVQNFWEILMHDWSEFLEWHEHLVQAWGDLKSSSEMAAIVWLNLSVIPFVAVCLYEYQNVNTSFEKGMPGGLAWYLPVRLGKNPDGTAGRLKLPIHNVLEWWEKLLGDDLTVFAKDLFAAGTDVENAKRQVREWKFEDRPPDQATIDRWCKVCWTKKYNGAFSDDVRLPLSIRWERCREFIIKKGLHAPKQNWLDNVEEQIKKDLQARYRGELLELQIMPFKDIPFARFFESSDPIADGLPVEKFITRIAERYAMPTNAQLKARLIVAAAFQRALAKLREWRDEEFAMVMCRYFRAVYNFIADLHQDGHSREKVLRRLQQTPKTQEALRYACEWLFTDNGRPEIVAFIVRAGYGPP